MSTAGTRPWSQGRGTMMLGIAGLVLIAAVGLSYREWRQYSRAIGNAAETRAIVDSVDRVVASLTDAVSGQRGFLLTGEDKYLEPYRRARQEIPGELARATQLLAARPGETAQVARLKSLTADELAGLGEAIERRRRSGMAAAQSIILSDRGQQTMDEIRSIVGEIRRTAMTSQSQASTEGQTAAGTALLVTIVGALVVLFLFAFGLQPFASPEPRAWQRSRPLRYSAAVLSVAAIALLRAALTPLIGGTNLPFTLFFCAVAFTAWFGGFRPAVLAIALSLMAGAYFFAAPTGSLWVSGRDDQVAMLMIVVVGFGMALLSRAQRGAVDRALRAESSERNERQRFETTLNSIGDAVITTDANGNVALLNAVAESLTGWKQEEAAGKPLGEVFVIRSATTGLEVESPVAKVLREGRIVGLANHTRLIARDGRQIPIDDSAAPIREGGKVEGVVLVFRDITERLKAEERMRLTVEAAPNAMIMVGREGRIELVNSQTEKLFGYQREELLGEPVEILVPERYRGGHGALRRSFLDAPLARPMGAGRDLFGLRKDGSEVPIEIGLNPISSAQGDFILAAVVDISERKRAEGRLRSAEERMRLALEASNLGTWELDLRDGRLEWSARHKELFGFAPDAEVNIEAALERIHEDDRQRMREAVYGLFRADAQTECQWEYRVVEGDGLIRWIEAKGKAITSLSNGNQPNIRVVGTVCDITEQKQTEELRRETQKLESLGILAGGIAHDFNNLLTGVIGNASLLAEAIPADSGQMETIESILQASERMARLTSQMLAYAGRGMFTTEVQDLSKQVIQITNLIQASVPANVQLRMALANDLPFIEVDPSQLQQVIMNLVINAAEAIGQHAGTVEVTTGVQTAGAAEVSANITRQRVPTDEYVVLTVRDTGCGMDESTIERIFDPFYTTKFTGRGLGLSAVLGIVRQHKGLITVDSTPGAGTTFRIYFPKSEARRAAGEGEAPHLRQGSGGIILVVDDEQIIRSVANAALKRLGYEVITANDGAEAVRIFASMPESITAVLLDMAMPVMGGEETLKRLVEIRPDVRVLITSGYSESEVQSKFGNPAIDFIQKPFTVAKLSMKIAGVLRAEPRRSIADSQKV